MLAPTSYIRTFSARYPSISICPSGYRVASTSAHVKISKSIACVAAIAEENRYISLFNEIGYNCHNNNLFHHHLIGPLLWTIVNSNSCVHVS